MTRNDETVEESGPAGNKGVADTLPASDSDPSESVQSTAADAPAKVGRYVVEGSLGEGGMGVVLAARDPALARPVALKLIKPTRAGSEGKLRLLREAQAMAKLSHANVVAVFDVGTHHDDVFVAMERINGSNLREWLDAKPRTWEQLWPVFRDAARGLEAAHKAGIIHRDFKPANVLVDEDGRAQVTDFGLARGVDDAEAGDHSDALTESAGSLSSTVTRTGAIMGTPRYMSPEQHAGRRVDTKTDQFSFCVALYQALYGEPPFAGATSMELAAEVAAGNVREAPKDSRVSAHLRGVLLRGLSVAPAKRFESMGELIDALEPGSGTHVWRWLAGVTIVVAASAAITVLVPRAGSGDSQKSNSLCKDTGAKMQALWSDSRKAQIRTSFVNAKLTSKKFDATARVLDDYAKAWTNSRADACEATNVRGDQSPRLMDKRMSCLDQRLAGMSKLLQLMASKDAKLVARAAGVAKRLSPIKHCNDIAQMSLEGAEIPPHLQARATELLGEIQQQRVLAIAGRLKEALQAQEKSYARATKLGIGPVRANLRFRIGETYLFMGKIPESEANLRSAIKLAEEVKDDRTRAHAMMRLAHIVGRMKRRFSEGLNLLELAEAATKRSKSKDGLARIYATRGFILDSKGDTAGAIKAHRLAVKHTELVDGKTHGRVGTRLNSLSQVLADADKLKEALETSLRAREISIAAYGPNHIRVAVGASYLADIYARLRRYKEAVAAYEQTIRITTALQGPNNKWADLAETNLGGVYADMNQHDKALVHYRRSRAICTAMRGKDSVHCAMVIHNIGTSLDVLGKVENARKMLELALTIRRKALKPTHPEVGLSHLALADLHRRNKKLAKALEHFQKGLAIYKKSSGAEHSMIARINHSIAKVHLAAGRPARAIPALTAALAIARKRKVYREMILTELGDVYREVKKDCAKAVPYYQEATRLYEAQKLTNAVTSDPIFSVARCAMTAGRHSEAVLLLRTVVARRLPSNNAASIAAARFSLAEALWPNKASRAEALTVAKQARTGMASAGKRYTKPLGQIDRWLATHKQ